MYIWYGANFSILTKNVFIMSLLLFQLRYGFCQGLYPFFPFSVASTPQKSIVIRKLRYVPIIACMKFHFIEIEFVLGCVGFFYLCVWAFIPERCQVDLT